MLLLPQFETVYHRNQLVRSDPCEERGVAGPICYECNVLSNCFHSGGMWFMIPVEKCPEGTYCNVREKKCSNATGPCNRVGYEGNFVCTSEGTFPDPYDCQKYHLCHKVLNQLVAASTKCRGNEAFSAATGSCSLTITDVMCQQLQFSCQFAGDSGAWPNNKNIFYVCKVPEIATTSQHQILFPVLYRCGQNEIFAQNRCINQSSSNNVDINNWIDTDDSIEENQKPQFSCRTMGLYSDPKDCKSYYYCDSSLKTQHYSCPRNSYFNQDRKSCQRGVCGQ